MLVVAAPKKTPQTTSKPSTSSSSSRLLSPRRQRRPRRSASTATAAAALPISADVVALVAFSAIPFLGVQALADSGAGKKLAEDLERRKPGLLKIAAEAERRRQRAAREEKRFFGPERGRWLPAAVSDSLGQWALAPHLPGEVAGDCGFDPLGLCRRTPEERGGEASGGKGPSKSLKKARNQQQQQQGKSLLDQALFDRYFELELLHARWAMLGALGALVPEALSLAGLAAFPEDRWQFVGRARLQGTDLNYLGVPGLVVAGKQGEWEEAGEMGGGGGESGRARKRVEKVARLKRALERGRGKKTHFFTLSSSTFDLFSISFFRLTQNRRRDHRRVPGED